MPYNLANIAQLINFKIEINSVIDRCICELKKNNLSGSDIRKSLTNLIRYYDRTKYSFDSNTSGEVVEESDEEIISDEEMDNSGENITLISNRINMRNISKPNPAVIAAMKRREDKIKRKMIGFKDSSDDPRIYEDSNSVGNFKENNMQKKFKTSLPKADIDLTDGGTNYGEPFL